MARFKEIRLIEKQRVYSVRKIKTDVKFYKFSQPALILSPLIFTKRNYLLMYT